MTLDEPRPYKLCYARTDANDHISLSYCTEFHSTLLSILRYFFAEATKSGHEYQGPLKR
jgi:hypothetical protein